MSGLKNIFMQHNSDIWIAAKWLFTWNANIYSTDTYGIHPNCTITHNHWWEILHALLYTSIKLVLFVTRNRNTSITSKHGNRRKWSSSSVYLIYSYCLKYYYSRIKLITSISSAMCHNVRLCAAVNLFV
jgi:hypothetical protein